MKANIVTHDDLRGADQHVKAIKSLMQSGDWIRGKTGRRLAKDWGVDDVVVRGYAAAAAQQLRMEGDPKWRRSYVIGKLHEIIESTDSDGAKIAALKVMLDAEGGARGVVRGELELPYEEKVRLMAKELMDPGPELAEALRRVGAVLPFRPVRDTVGEQSVEEDAEDVF